MQRRKTGKISIFSSLDVIFDCLMNRVENLNSDSTRDRYRVGSRDWYRVFRPSHDIDIEYSDGSESRYENSTWRSVYWRQEQKIEASIFLITLFDYSNYCMQSTRWCDDATYWSCRILLILKLDASDRAYVKVLSQVHIHYDLHVVHWWSRRKQECCDLQKLTRQVVRAVIKLTQINLSYRGLHSDVPPVCCEVSRALTRRGLARALTRRGLATLARLRTEARVYEYCARLYIQGYGGARCGRRGAEDCNCRKSRYHASWGILHSGWERYVP